MALRRLQRGFKGRGLIEKVVENLKKELDGIPIIVEGKMDKKPLISLGFKNILAISGNTLYNTTEYISSEHKAVLILTDYDREGRKKAAILTKLLNHRGIKTLPRYRHLFRNVFGVIKIQDIDSLIKDTWL